MGLRSTLSGRHNLRAMKVLRLAVVGLVLVGVLVTTYATFLRRGEEARRAGSARNLRQWGIALNLYLIDNKNQLPATGRAPVTSEQEDAWFNALPPYISQKPLAELPPGERPRPGVASLWVDPATKPVRAWDPEVYYFNYGMNSALQPEAGVRSFRIYEIPHPELTVFLTEVDGFEPSTGPEDVAFRHGRARPHSPEAKSHVLFCDGHVQAVNRAELVDDPSARSTRAAEEGSVSWFME
jgi:prepilin-type processing-associated H-X9-DG protein